jgi:serine/threonine-protein kinase
MQLAPGIKLGTYRIAGILGSGGMGEVYRARDEKLERDVAIKVMAERFASHDESRARFEREAKLLAALNHPGIATLHSVDEREGRLLLVMELVEGETLAGRISRGPIEWPEAQRLFVQMAQAIEAAHAKGVLHRDLKPANVMITPEGRVKILDFGLAKLVEAELDATRKGGALETPPKQATHTAVFGTAGYMSPEQARGKLVDRRTDVWAFGCCLYEALTGQKAFAGDTLADILAAVMTSEPDFSRLPPGTPPAVVRALRRSLMKDVAKRLHDVADFRLELEEDASGPPPKERSIWRLERVAVIAVVAVAAALVTALILRAPASEPRRFEITFRPGESPDPIAVSPDGRRIVYSSLGDGTPRLFVRDFDRLESRALPGTELGLMPVFSPDGTEIAFHAGIEPGRIRRVRLEGGSPVDVTPSRYTWWAGMDWGTDDTIVFSEGSLGLSRVPADGGEPETLTEVDGAAGERFHIEPRFLPGERAVLFTVISVNGSGRTEVLTLDGKKRSVVEGVGPFARFVESGHMLYPRSGSVLVVPFDVARRSSAGREVPLGFPVEGRLEGLPERPPYLDWSVDGTLVYFPPGGVTSRAKSFVWVDRSGRKAPIGRAESTENPSPRLSPDGRRLAFTSEKLQVWVLNLDSDSAPLRLTFQGDHRWPVWSPDGKRLALTEGGAGVANVVTLASDGSETKPRLIASFPRDRVPVQIFPTGWTPDGKEVLLFDGESVWVVDAERESEPRRLFDTPFRELTPSVSPDGRAIAYLSDRSGEIQIFVSPYPDVASEAPLQISRNGGFEPRWSRDGRELYFREGKRLMATSIERSGGTLRAGAPTAIFELAFSPLYPVPSVYDVAPDGRFLVLEFEAPHERSHAVVVENWFTELDRLAPK